MINMKEQILAKRLGKSWHASPLRYKFRRLQEKYPAPHSNCVEDWLIDVANARGVRIIMRPDSRLEEFTPPDINILSLEELIVGICQLQCLDRPQMLRLAAQFISRGVVDLKMLFLVAERERVEPILKELARQALKVDKTHRSWNEIHTRYKDTPPPRDTLLHWTRLAEPVLKKGMLNASHWRLVK